MPPSPRPPTPPLPAPPAITLTIAKDKSQGASVSGGFLNLRRLELVAHYPDGTSSAPFPYDLAVRKAVDAVVMAVHFVRGGQRHVFLRSALRPPLALRTEAPLLDGGLWELPAGLIEPGESPEAAAARELQEELGFVIPAQQMKPLGPWSTPTPAVIAERHVYFHAEVDEAARRPEPTLDGSALERGASIVAVALEDALEHCRQGRIPDAKTELALRRLAEALPSR